MFLVLVAVLFNACSSEQSSLTGTYVNHAQSGFSIADDTLTVTHDKDQNYLIHRKTGFQLIDDSGKKGELILESEELKAVYDEGSASMAESKKGRVISFDSS